MTGGVVPARRLTELPSLERLLLVVVGAHLRAEAQDRTTAYALAERLRTVADGDEEARAAGLEAMVCTDIWWLNTADLHACASVSVGAPGLNALTAFLAERVPTALSVRDTLSVQVDVEMSELRAAVWGVDWKRTAEAAELFGDRHSGAFVRAAARRASR